MSKSQLMVGREADWDLEEVTKAALTQSPDLSVLYEQASATVAYFGKAVAGSATDAAAWFIKRITLGNDGSVTIEHVQDGVDFTQIWDNRVSLTYV